MPVVWTLDIFQVGLLKFWAEGPGPLIIKYYQGPCSWCILHTLQKLGQVQCHKLGKIFTCPMHKLLLSSTVISDVYRSFTPNKTTFIIKCCVTLWIWKLSWSFEIHRVRQYLVNFTGLAGIVKATLYKIKPIIIFTGLGHGKLSQLLTLLVYYGSQMESRDHFVYNMLPANKRWRYNVTCCQLCNSSTHWGRDKMDAISQTKFSRTFT